VRRRILVVDDEPEIIEILREYLERSYEVDSALDATEALRLVRARRPDLILLDINMPGISGVDALKLVKDIDATIPVLMVTANTDNALAAEAIRHGAFSYIPKPFNVKYLDHLIAAAWSR
jgi:DNA-binding NtrC family response regulator